MGFEFGVAAGGLGFEWFGSIVGDGNLKGIAADDVGCAAECLAGRIPADIG